MSSTNKTDNLKLNSWIGTDKPKREDFVNDNFIIDKAITDHINDQNVHITAADIENLGTTIISDVVNGTGEAYCEHTLSFSPKFVIVYTIGKPLCEYNTTNNYTVCNAGIAYMNQSGSTSGLEIIDNTLVMYQTQETPTNGIFRNLNASGAQYRYIAFK